MIKARGPRPADMAAIPVLLLGIIIPLLTLHLGFYPWKDEEYQIMCINDYQNTPLAAFTMYIGHLWAEYIAVDSFMSYRYLAYICNTLSIALPCCYFYVRHRRLLTTAIIFLILQLCISLFGLFSFEWDTTTHLFLTLGCLIAILYIRKPCLWKIITLGVISSSAIFSRIPNIAVVPVLLILIAFTRRNIPPRVKDMSVYLLSLAVSSIAIILLVWGSFSSFGAAWSPDNYITGHSSITDVLFMQLWMRYPVSMRYFFMWEGIFALIYFLNISGMKKIWKYVSLGIIVLLIAALWLVIRVTSDDVNSYPIDFFYFSTALITAYAVIKRREIRYSIIVSLTILAFALVSYVGSDCGLSKILCMPLMPIVLAELYRYRSHSLNELFCTLALVVIICYIPLRLKNPWTREWINRYDAEYTDIPQLKGIKHSPQAVEARTKIYEWALPIEQRGEKILFIGHDRYMFDYILGHRTDNVDRYPIQRYHDDNKFENVEGRMYDMADRFDYIYLGYSFNDSDIDKISNKLAAKGFYLYLSDKDYSIWKK